MSELDGAVVVITGGGGGLGSALAREAAGRGGRIVIADVADTSDLVQELRAGGASAESFEVDVSEYDQVQKLVEFTKSKFGEVNILINCVVAALARGDDALATATGPLWGTSPVYMRRMFEVNVLGYYNASRAFAETLLESAAAGRPAHIMNVGSEHSLGVPPHVPPMSAYTVTKYNMLALTDVSRRDFAGTGVNVSMFAPGWILTEVTQQVVDNSEEWAEHIMPYAQTAGFTAKAAFDGLVKNEYIIFPNTRITGYAIEHAEAILAVLREAEARVLPDDAWARP